MALTKVLVIILAGGAGSRLGLLTQGRAKPAVPFGGSFRLVDFPLSNCQHSHTPDVWVVEQYNPVSLADHLANGRPWDLDRGSGGLLVLHPHQGDGRSGWHSGTADALWRQAPLIREFDPGVLVVVSADAVYRCDYRELADTHLASGAAVTMVTSEVSLEEAGRYDVVETDQGAVTGYAHKPDDPRSTTVTAEVFAFDPEVLLETLERLTDEVGEEGLEDLGDHGLPQLVDAGRARALPLQGYWQDVGTIEAYWQAHMDLIADEPSFDLHDRSWPVHTQGPRIDGARLGDGSQVSRSLVGPGCRVDGEVVRSVLSPGVVVEAGAVVRDCVLLDDVVVCAGAVVQRAVVDAGARVGRGARVGGDGDVAVLGQDHDLVDGERVGAGEQRPDPQG